MSVPRLLMPRPELTGGQGWFLKSLVLAAGSSRGTGGRAAPALQPTLCSHSWGACRRFNSQVLCGDTRAPRKLQLGSQHRNLISAPARSLTSGPVAGLAASAQAPSQSPGFCVAQVVLFPLGIRDARVVTLQNWTVA